MSPPEANSRTVDLSEVQTQLWVLQQLHPGLLVEPQVVTCRIRGPLDLPRLREAVAALSHREELVRARIHSSAGAPRLAIELPQSAPEVSLLEGPPLMGPAAAFDTSLSPLVRLHLAPMGPNEHLLTAIGSPLVMDRIALRALVRSLWFPDPAANLLLPQVDANRSSTGYWAKALEGVPSRLELGESGGQRLPPFPLAQLEVPLDGALLARIKPLDVEPVLLAAVQLVLTRYTRQERCPVGVVARTPGVWPALNVLPLAVTGRPVTCAELIDVTRASIEAARAHAGEPALSQLRAEGDSSPARMIQVRFSLDSKPLAFTADGVTITEEAPAPTVGWSELLVNVRRASDGYVLTIDYDRERYEQGFVARLGGHLCELLRGLIEQPNARVATLPLITPGERQLLLHDWNGERMAFPDACVHQLFAEQVQKTPDAIALTFGEKQLSYRQLDAWTNRAAHVLQSRGVGPEQTVAVCLRPSMNPVIAFLSVLKAGGAYVPLDPDAPKERLKLIVAKASPKAILTDAVTRELAAGLGDLVDIDSAEVQAAPDDPVSSSVRPENLAYIVFTSGSTGEPKGVLVPHSALANHNRAVKHHFELRPTDRVLQFTPVNFDAAGEEIYPPLITGAAVVVRGELVPTGEFDELIERERLSVLSLPPAYVQEWLPVLEKKGGRIPRCLRLVLLGGEKLLPETRALWNRLGGRDIPWINVYGPTEATITSAFFKIVGDAGLTRPSLPIGRPVANAYIYLLDEERQFVPPNDVGELYVGGAGLARGYLGQPELTAEKFVPDPHNGVAGSRLYRTGDLARHLPNGSLEFVGRADHQVKLRGYRIEPGEIEVVLRRAPGVQDVVVLVRDDPPAPRRLVAYVVPTALPLDDGGHRAFARTLQESAAAALPDYMVPSAFVLIPSLPLTSNGKVDRKALPAPDDRSLATAAQFAEPRDEQESALVSCFRDVLGVQRVSVFDNFFELGGNSMAAMQLVVLATERLGSPVDLVDVFDAPTISDLAALLKTRALAGSGVNVDELSDQQVEAMLADLSRHQR